MFLSSFDDLYIWGQNWPNKIWTSICQVPFLWTSSEVQLLPIHLNFSFTYWMSSVNMSPSPLDPSIMIPPTTPPLYVSALLLPIPINLLALVQSFDSSPAHTHTPHTCFPTKINQSHVTRLEIPSVQKFGDWLLSTFATELVIVLEHSIDHGEVLMPRKSKRIIA